MDFPPFLASPSIAASTSRLSSSLPASSYSSSSSSSTSSSSAFSSSVDVDGDGNANGNGSGSGSGIGAVESDLSVSNVSASVSPVIHRLADIIKSSRQSDYQAAQARRRSANTRKRKADADTHNERIGAPHKHHGDGGDNDNDNAATVAEQSAVSGPSTESKSELNLDSSESDSSASNGPRVGIGANGELILDESSLVLQATDDPADSLMHHNSAVHSAYGSRTHSEKWSAADTRKFYQCLMQFGTDFQFFQPHFGTRTRKQLRLKFKREERMQPMLIDRLLNTRMEINRPQFEHKMKSALSLILDSSKQPNIQQTLSGNAVHHKDTSNGKNSRNTTLSGGDDEKEKEKEVHGDIADVTLSDAHSNGSQTHLFSTSASSTVGAVTETQSHAEVSAPTFKRSRGAGKVDGRRTARNAKTAATESLHTSTVKNKAAPALSSTSLDSSSSDSSSLSDSSRDFPDELLY